MYFDSIERSIIYMHVHVFNILFLSFVRNSFYFFVSFFSIVLYVFRDSNRNFPIDEHFFSCAREREKKIEKGKWTFALHKKQSTTIYDASKNQINIKMVSFNDETSGKHEYEVFCTIAKEKNNMKMTKRMKRKKNEHESIIEMWWANKAWRAKNIEKKIIITKWIEMYAFAPTLFQSFTSWLSSFPLVKEKHTISSKHSHAYIIFVRLSHSVQLFFSLC